MSPPPDRPAVHAGPLPAPAQADLLMHAATQWIGGPGMATGRVARWLSAGPRVAWVSYPGLAIHPGHGHRIGDPDQALGETAAPGRWPGLAGALG